MSENEEFTLDMDVAYKFVESMVPKANKYDGPAPLWHGWALREAFLAGVKWERDKEQTAFDDLMAGLKDAGAKETHECTHERLNDHGDACLDCGAVWYEGRWQ